MSQRKPFRKFKKHGPSLTTEQKVKQFIIRNSKNGYFTRVSTISYKFDVTEEKAWEIVGEFLSDGSLESTHDAKSGQMKLCEPGKTYAILDLEQKRRKEKFKNNKQQNS